VTALEVSITTTTYANMGDHAVRLVTAHEYLGEETVADLVRRVLPDLTSPYGRFDATDEVTLRVVVGIDGKPTGEERAAPHPDPWADIPTPRTGDRP
jgi:hypothetical protein